MPNISGDVIFLSFMEYKVNKVLIQLSNLRPVKALYSRDNKYDTNRQRLAPSPCWDAGALWAIKCPRNIYLLSFIFNNFEISITLVSVVVFSQRPSLMMFFMLLHENKQILGRFRRAPHRQILALITKLNFTPWKSCYKYKINAIGLWSRKLFSFLLSIQQPRLLDSLRAVFSSGLVDTFRYFSLLATTNPCDIWHLPFVLSCRTNLHIFWVVFGFLSSVFFFSLRGCFCGTLSCFCRIASVSCSFVHIWHVRCENFFNITVNSWCRLRNYGSSKKVCPGNVRICVWAGWKINQQQSSWSDELIMWVHWKKFFKVLFAILVTIISLILFQLNVLKDKQPLNFCQLIGLLNACSIFIYIIQQHHYIW